MRRTESFVRRARRLSFLCFGLPCQLDEPHKEIIHMKNGDDNFASVRVLIIGFGNSGIVQTHTLVIHGFGRNLVVVEAEKSLGGVWNLSKHYPGLSNNNTKNTFQLPELQPREGDFVDYPTQEQVNAFLQRYVASFDFTIRAIRNIGPNHHKTTVVAVDSKTQRW